ncbi:FkbM family methyltransferase [Desulfovibrio sp. G11]|uniref:FkbM family methyltransferase n=1 Tax=Desulfovibrio sp. G11 TaxID=631220 RepID=UPI0012FDBF71|nr:FkbM family methyltransferase [Desulfovibrio sp. G11]
MPWQRSGNEKFSHRFLGVGNTALYYSGILEYEGIRPDFFVDTAAEKVGARINGIVIADGRRICSLNNPLVLVATTARETFFSIKKQALALNSHARCISVDAYVLAKNERKIQETLNIFSDQASREKYLAVVESRKKLMDVPPWLVESPMFRYESGLPFQLPRLNDVVVDAGAYCGDSLEKFLFSHDAHIQTYYAFEPDDRYFAALLTRCQRLVREWALNEETLVPVKNCLSRYNGSGVLRNWNLAGGGSALLSADAPVWGQSSTVDVTTIDTFFAHKEVTFIKADIEGAEYDMLLGAQETICRCKPRLAISLYHNPSDMYRIPLLLKNFAVNYQFAFHHYSPTWGDSLLYAW